MKKPAVMVLVLAVIITAIISVRLILSTSNNNTKSLSNRKETNISEVIKYKTDYVGDNSAVFNIITNLPGGAFEHSMVLQTDSKPYGIEISYGISTGSNIDEQQFNEYWTTEDMQKIFVNNATALFVLVNNLDKVTLKLEKDQGKIFTITRKDLEAFYGKDLRKYASDTALWDKEVLTDTLNSKEKLRDFFKLHAITEPKTKVETIN